MTSGLTEMWGVRNFDCGIRVSGKGRTYDRIRGDIAGFCREDKGNRRSDGVGILWKIGRNKSGVRSVEESVMRRMREREREWFMLRGVKKRG